MATEEAVQAALRQGINPGLGINVVDLGLIYSLDIEGNAIHVAMTMTTSTCPLSGYIQEAAEAAIWQQVSDVDAVEIELVWMRHWRPDVMSDAANQKAFHAIARAVQAQLSLFVQPQKAGHHNAG